MNAKIKNNLYALITVVYLSGCASGTQQLVRFDEESMHKAGFNKAHIECDKIASDFKTDISSNAVGGAAIGAGIYALTGAILGVNAGTLAGVGALHGGLSGAGSAVIRNRNNYRSVLIQCMRDRGFMAY